MYQVTRLLSYKTVSEYLYLYALFTFASLWVFPVDVAECRGGAECGRVLL